ncbi:MAG: DUF3472 domain-containing protein [Akkermansiaceae bacterium]|nr:DUF3472 domain-containing protein [Akkermansiaceae bacterium]
MFPTPFRFLVRLSAFAALPVLAPLADAARFDVPMGGNAYVTAPESGAGAQVRREGLRAWDSPEAVVSIYFFASAPGPLALSINLNVPEGSSKIAARLGDHTTTIDVAGKDTHDVPLGNIDVAEPGYIRVDLKGLSKDGSVFADVEGLIAETGEGTQEIRCVADNEGNRFYWGRRGPSVHLGYDFGTKEPIEYHHTAVTVPKGEDPAGSYYMANGFGQGYFGMQAKGDHRWILFSVWSPFQTQNPRDIPEDQRIRSLARGEGVHVGEFGNEGSGGQTYLVYPWETGKTYRFLNSAKPDGKGNTIYTAWFRAPDSKDWRLVASLLRPKTNTHLTGMHSFLENFADRQGFLGRKAFYSEVWARDTSGHWHAAESARFTADDIARRSYRLDFTGGSDDGRFFLRNGGFFHEPREIGSRITLDPAPADPPRIDFTTLPRS